MSRSPSAGARAPGLRQETERRQRHRQFAPVAGFETGEVGSDGGLGHPFTQRRETLFGETAEKAVRVRREIRLIIRPASSGAGRLPCPDLVRDLVGPRSGVGIGVEEMLAKYRFLDPRHLCPASDHRDLLADASEHETHFHAGVRDVADQRLCEEAVAAGAVIGDVSGVGGVRDQRACAALRAGQPLNRLTRLDERIVAAGVQNDDAKRWIDAVEKRHGCR